MLTHEEASTLFKQLVAVNAEMDQHTAQARDISDRLTIAKVSGAKIPHDELDDMLPELLKNQQGFRSCSLRGVGLLASTDARRLQLETLWRSDRGDFLAEYRRVVGESPGSSAALSKVSMIDRIIERESSEERLGR
jgi:hypothetical protein